MSPETSKIDNTGKLRATLADTIIQVREGSIDIDSARTMVKLAAQINESFYSEIKARQVMADAKEATVALGQLQIA